MKKMLGTMFALCATAFMLTSCCCDRYDDCCEPCPAPCAPKPCAPRPCARPCPKPCPAPCPAPCETRCY